MSEEGARAWIAERFGVNATDTLATLLSRVAEENQHQNLIAPSTVDAIWSRHALDSAQLVPLAPTEGLWVDIGTGGGFPGLVVAVLRSAPMLLVEPRRLRAEFLQRCATDMGLDHVEVRTAKVEAVRATAAVISARAVAPVENLLQAAHGCAKANTRWLLPRGRLGPADLASLRRNWRGVFHVEQSLTDPESSILVLDGVSRR